jgi:GTP-binding protein
MPTVAILGRPNVGKSTLFNRLCGLRVALVDSTPGVTRDRRTGLAKLADLEFDVIDTAGLDDAEAGTMEASMQQQTERALLAADVVLLMIDARIGLTPMDRYFSDWLRKAPIPIILVANKCESKAAQAGIYEAYELGFGEPVAISAEHGEGMADLHISLAPYLDAASASEDLSADPGDGTDEDDAGPMQLAIVGRPNVGKSTLLNRLVGDERVITGPKPGVTRDAIAVAWDWHGQDIKLIDTAGLRRRARIQEKIEKLSAADSLRSIRFAQVVVLVLDATTMAEKQDLSIADHVIREGRALVIVANKWDQVDDRKAAMEDLRDRLQRSLPQVRGIPIVTLSALTGEGIDRLMPAVTKVFKIWNIRLSTGPLNRWLEDVLERHPPPLSRGRRLRIRYVTQVKSRPPTFVIFSTRPADLPESYSRYLVNSLRDAFGLDGVPIRLNLRRGNNPYDPGK